MAMPVTPAATWNEFHADGNRKPLIWLFKPQGEDVLLAFVLPPDSPGTNIAILEGRVGEPMILKDMSAIGEPLDEGDGDTVLLVFLDEYGYPTDEQEEIMKENDYFTLLRDPDVTWQRVAVTKYALEIDAGFSRMIATKK